MRLIRALAVAALVAVTVVGCGDDDTGGPGERGAPTIVVTTTVLGDVVSSMLGEAARVVTVMPPGVSPHDFQASARQVATMRDAELLIVNGGGFEEALRDVIEAAERDGVPVYAAMSEVAHDDGHDVGDGHDAGDGHDDHEGDDHDHDGDAHDHDDPDPHFFTDPVRMAAAARGILAHVLEAVPELDRGDVRAHAEAYLAELDALDAEIEAILAPIPSASRVLVTNHGVLNHFAERYGFEIAGTVIPTGSTADGVSASALAKLADVVRDNHVRALFTDASSSDALVRTLADEVGDVEVVELFTESLGEKGSGAESYLEMMRTNARRIADALS